jgi:hypothetical protein
MEASPLQLTHEQSAALADHPGQPLYIEDAETRETYLLLKAGQFPELEEEYVRAKLEEGFAAIDRGEEEEWNSESVKSEGRHLLSERRGQPKFRALTPNRKCRRPEFPARRRSLPGRPSR